ncbi:hypothetical protein KK087_00450 [Curtobacterium flaccumfaciens pv. flaccumfaciens]|nr:hypothetical protein [Curtobacterium flaccumfaciens pv. flaccumfaciens]
MEYAAERWVQRLRDGEMPKRWPFLIGLAIVTVAGGIGVVFSITHVDAILHSDARRPFAVPLFSVILLVLGPVAAVLSRVRSRSDGRILAAIRQHGTTPRFHLPVLRTGAYTLDDFPEPRPEMWTVDAAGLHAWSSERGTPVFDLAWSAIRSIELASAEVRGQRTDTGIWIITEDVGRFAVQPRPAVGRPFGASATKIHIVMQVLRSLRRELGAQHDDARPGRTRDDR